MIWLNEKEQKLVNKLKATNQETYYHSIRVMEFTLKLLNETAFAGITSYSDIEANIILKGALLHDVGKLYIDKAILNKPSALSDTEMEQMKQHTVLGYNALKEELLHDERDILENICLYHHERIDGSGYVGLTELPLYLQIVAIADVYDALRSDRVYRQGLPKQKCLEIIRDSRDRSGAFDDALVSCLDKVTE